MGISVRQTVHFYQKDSTGFNFKVSNVYQIHSLYIGQGNCHVLTIGAKQVAKIFQNCPTDQDGINEMIRVLAKFPENSDCTCIVL